MQKLAITIVIVLVIDLLTLMPGKFINPEAKSISFFGIFGAKSYFTAFK